MVAGLDNQVWDRKAQAFADWVHKHSSTAAALLIKMYEADDSPGDDNSYAAYLAVECTDSPWPLNWGQWNRDVWTMYLRAPFAWANAWFDAPCIFWSAPSSQLFKVNGNGISSVLLIEETLNAASPYAGSLVVRRLFPHAVLLAEPGGTSDASSLSRDTCVDGTIAAYLTTGALPARKPGPGPDATSAPLPPPDPSSLDPAIKRVGTRPNQLPDSRLRSASPQSSSGEAPPGLRTELGKTCATGERPLPQPRLARYWRTSERVAISDGADKAARWGADITAPPRRDRVTVASGQMGSSAAAPPTTALLVPPSMS